MGCLFKGLSHARTLLRKGVKVDIKSIQGFNALTQCLCYTYNPKLAMLLFAAGETIDKTKVNNVPYYLKLSADICLKNICREAIRDNLLGVANINLFVRVPQLPLPTVMTSFLLFDVTLDEEH